MRIRCKKAHNTIIDTDLRENELKLIAICIPANYTVQH